MKILILDNNKFIIEAFILKIISTYRFTAKWILLISKMKSKWGYAFEFIVEYKVTVLKISTRFYNDHCSYLSRGSDSF